MNMLSLDNPVREREERRLAERHDPLAAEAAWLVKHRPVLRAMVSALPDDAPQDVFAAMDAAEDALAAWERRLDREGWAI